MPKALVPVEMCAGNSWKNGVPEFFSSSEVVARPRAYAPVARLSRTPDTRFRPFRSLEPIIVMQHERGQWRCDCLCPVPYALCPMPYGRRYHQSVQVDNVYAIPQHTLKQAPLSGRKFPNN